MSYLSELTAHERLTVDNATLDMFTAFENGSDLIYDIWEQYFSDRERKNIESRDLEFIGRILYSVYDRMANAIRDYHLMLGHYDAPGVQCFLETAKRAQLTADAEKAREHAQKEMRSAPYTAAHKQALGQLGSIHFQRDEKRLVSGSSCTFCKVEQKSRLADPWASTDDDELSPLEPLQNAIQFWESRIDTGLLLH